MIVRTFICANFILSLSHITTHVSEAKSQPVEKDDKFLSSWIVLDIGMASGLLLQEVSKQGFSDLTGTDYSEGAIDLARSLADRDGFSNIKFLVDDILETKLDRQFQLIMDKGTLDAIGLHPDGPIKRMMYWDSVSKLLAPGGILVSTLQGDYILQPYKRRIGARGGKFQSKERYDIPRNTERPSPFRYLNQVRTYPTFMFGGSVGSLVATVAFLRN
ncbi:methyltransferase-like protein 10 isoform 2 [Hibiscus syriacus]|uniref:Methyltransferase-like protein 10 isoform 2 n=1 Tax=Hibiscus syriacus TaxID=106335 RepID=A0A6A2ZT97_HIBSY|nr:methyltransferase-like protein 10 isoform 2 [Hibiscus syriacus]